MPSYTLYTDGGCNPNPGPGGWGAVILAEGESPRELCGGAPDTTNNRMELTAAAEALRALPEGASVDLHTDSVYVRDGITKWIEGWRRSNWKTKAKEDVKNRDLWERLDAEITRREVRWHWVKGHSGNPWNELADALATSAIEKAPLPLGDESAVHLFTAAAYSGKSRIGGYGVVLEWQGEHRELSGAVSEASPNRMHLLAAAAGLEALKRPTTLHVYTVSDYLRDGAVDWTPAWRARGWRTKTGGEVSHRDVWERIAELGASHRAEWHVVGASHGAVAQLERAKALASEAVAGAVSGAGGRDPAPDPGG